MKISKNELIKLIQECVVEESSKRKIGDTFSAYGGTYGFYKDSKELIEWKGHHPNVEQFMGSTLKITGIDSNSYEINNEYKISKRILDDKLSIEDNDKIRRDEANKREKENEKLSSNYSIGDKLVALHDVYIISEYGFTRISDFGKKLFCKKGSSKLIKNVSKGGVQLAGTKDFIEFSEINQHFTKKD